MSDNNKNGNGQEYIVIEGARQNNLKGVNLKIPMNRLVVVTGVSGSGKSSLAFDTIYAEGQRRYVETFSPYTRQFLSRMDKPKVDRINGIPPAIAIDQTNPVRTSRSTVGTMTELADHLKLLSRVYPTSTAENAARSVTRDTPDSIRNALMREVAEARFPERAVIVFQVPIPAKMSEEEILGYLAKSGYHRIFSREEALLRVIQDRVSVSEENRQRITDDIEAALRFGSGKIEIHPYDSAAAEDGILRFSSDLHCPHCDIHYREPAPNLFSFNSPIGACDTCRGFGRTIGIDYGFVIPDVSKTLAGGAIKPWQTESYSECQNELMSFARARSIPTDVPWEDLDDSQKAWVIEGEGEWDDGVWYGVKRFFAWLESRSYKMHIRVLLSRYRSYRLCPDCEGARLKPESLLWRLGEERLSVHDIMLMPIERVLAFFENLRFSGELDEAGSMILDEIKRRLSYLMEVGLGYLSLDRQSRTLSGGEVQRINLTTALGTSLVNTLFILDEPSIGLHSRDIGRLIGILKRLRNAGNTIVVVEHDPEVIRAADLVIDMGPAAGEHGGEVVFFGSYHELIESRDSLTGTYLRGERRVSGENATDSPAADGRIAGEITIAGAAENNLKNIDVRIPLGKLVSITGVSGSGKSTLVENILYRGLLRLKRKATEEPGRHDSIQGHEQVNDVVLVDQSPIGRTTRSNPASYVGAFDAIRKVFVADPLSRSADYTIGTFSFNSGKDGARPAEAMDSSTSRCSF